MNKIKLLALFGESGAGKDTIQRWIISRFTSTHGLVSYTTRPKRDYEKEGREYYFITKENFKKLISEDKILEYTIFNWWYYGTCIDELKENKINIGVFNQKGIENLLKHTNNIDILPVWIKAPEKTRLLRCLNREMNPNCEEICRRFLADLNDFSNINFDYEIFLNDKNKDDYYGFFSRPKISKFLKDKLN